MIVPDYYSKFRCIGSECKNNCCCGEWEIEVDEEALERFAKIDGEFGERVRASVNEDGIFARKNGRCPMLSENGLCEMVLNGEKLCIVCDEYPRFTEFFGDYEERGISLSCEAAADIIINNPEKVNLVGSAGTCEDEMFDLLMSARDDVFNILQNRELDIKKRIRLVLDYGEALQEWINNNNYAVFSYEPVDRTTEKESTEPIFDFLLSLDYLDDAWYDILKKADSDYSVGDVEIEQIAVYFVYRYFLKALFDCDVLSKLKLMAISVIAICELSDACGNVSESARRYSMETEHNEENVDAIYDEFLFNEELSTEKIIGMIK